MQILQAPATAQKSPIWLQASWCLLLCRGNTSLRWNVAMQRKATLLHLDTANGSNCSFRVDNIGGGWYGIQLYQIGRYRLFRRYRGQSTRARAKVLHLWAIKWQQRLQGNDQRQFAFYCMRRLMPTATQYYIQNKKLAWSIEVGVEDTDKTTQAKCSRQNPFRPANQKKSVMDNHFQRSSSVSSRRSRKIWPRAVRMTSCEILGFGTIQGCKQESLRLHISELIYTFIRGRHQQQIGSSMEWENTEPTKYWRWQKVKKYVQLAAGILRGSGKRQGMLNVWTDDDFDKNYNTSQLWRFFGQSERGLQNTECPHR